MRYRMMDVCEDGERVAIGLVFQDGLNPKRDHVTPYYANEFQPPIRKSLEDLQAGDIRFNWRPEDLQLREMREATVEFDDLIDEIEKLMNAHEATPCPT